MEYHLRTKLNGNIAMTSCFHENSFLQRDRSLYKFIWVRHGTLDVEVDHVVMHLEKEEMISLTPLHHVQIRGVGGEYLTFLFNSNFYCIYRHDSEVSCNGFLFNGSSRVMRLKLSPSQSARLDSIVDIFRGECGNRPAVQRRYRPHSRTGRQRPKSSAACDDGFAYHHSRYDSAARRCA